ncbi:hypothetical protein KKF91_01310 [Myxococcota bacterium]|nr:hypothetical protein [Myxococcota bacterium]
MPDRIATPLMAALFLGLAPFLPEPHIVEKIRWLIEGHPFRAIDVFDILMHGAPWVWLLVALLLTAKDAIKNKKTKKET